MIVEITKVNRNKFSQDEEVHRFKILCKTFGKVNITDIKASDITKWQQQSSYAPRTILKFRSTMNSIFEMALSDDIILKNPLRFVKAPKKQHSNIRVFTEDEVKILIEQATGQLKNILMLAFFSGLRGSELIALRWNDIDFDAETIRIDSRIRQGDEDVPKSKRIRILDMLPQAKSALKKQWLLTGMKNDHVFLAQRNKPYVSHSNINEAIKKLCIDCGIEAGTLHVIRKTCNTLYKQYNLPLDWILDQIGHTDDDVNREHYTGRIKPDLSKIGRVLTESKVS
jgi:integrase